MWRCPGLPCCRVVCGGATWIWIPLIVGVAFAARGSVWPGLLLMYLPWLVLGLVALRRRHGGPDAEEDTADHAMVSDVDAWRSRFAGDVRALAARRQEEGRGDFA